MTKIKTAPKKKITEAEFDAAVSRHKTNTTAIGKIEANYQGKQDKLDAAKAKELGDKPKELAADEATIHQYCKDNREKMFADAQSTEIGKTTVGFRTNPHSVMLAEGADEKKEVEALITKFKKSKALELYVVTKSTLDKKKMITNREDKTLIKALVNTNVAIKQSETFYINHG